VFDGAGNHPEQTLARDRSWKPSCEHESMTADHPRLGAVVLDTTDARSLAEFYRELLGYAYRPGDEPTDRRNSRYWPARLVGAT
jgi:hypothetical protein